MVTIQDMAKPSPDGQAAAARIGGGSQPQSTAQGVALLAASSIVLTEARQHGCVAHLLPICWTSALDGKVDHSLCGTEALCTGRSWGTSSPVYIPALHLTPCTPWFLGPHPMQQCIMPYTRTSSLLRLRACSTTIAPQRASQSSAVFLKLLKLAGAALSCFAIA